MPTEFFIGLYILISAIAASFIAKMKNRDTNNWYTIGFVLGLIGVFAALVMPKLPEENS